MPMRLRHAFHVIVNTFPHAMGNWERNLRMSNDDAELILTFDVGPRILSYRLTDSKSPLKIFENQLGGGGELEWQIRGGHRLWFAPEEVAFTYCLDNAPVEHQILPDGSVRTGNPPVAPWNIRKEMTVRLADSGSSVEIEHRAIHEGSLPLHLAIWALTVMAPGGRALIPNPPLGEHPRDLLPERSLILWPFTNLRDSRLHLGKNFLTLSQGNAGPIKFGVHHRCGWAGYLREELLFTKTIEWFPDATYPDHGSNLELFTNEEMLEVESLAPMVWLEPGQSVSHRERWFLQRLPENLDLSDTDSPAFAEALAPLLAKAGL